MKYPFCTFSGRVIDLSDVKPEDIDLQDIARSLSQTNRYNGHTATPYSVAEHLCHIYDYLKRTGEPRDVLAAGLLHDAPEYILGEVTRPLKVLLGEAYTDIEDRVWSAVCLRFGISEEMPAVVKEVDRRIVNNETAELSPNHQPYTFFVEGYQGFPLSKRLPFISIIGMPPHTAEQNFLNRARELGLMEISQ